MSSSGILRRTRGWVSCCLCCRFFHHLLPLSLLKREERKDKREEREGYNVVQTMVEIQPFRGKGKYSKDRKEREGRKKKRKVLNWDRLRISCLTLLNFTLLFSF